MKIAIVGYAHPFGKDMVYGAERHLYYLMCELRKAGHDCVVFTVKGCNLPGFEYVPVDIPWKEEEDIYLPLIAEHEAKSGRKFDFIYSAMASGFVSQEIRNAWPYCVHPYMIFRRWNDNIVMYSKRLRAASNGCGTVIYFGLPVEQYPEYSATHNGYIVWLGRMDAGKAPDIAIEVAKRSGHRIVLMGPSYHYPYSVDHVLPHVDNDKVVWLRGCTDSVKQRVLLKAKALIAPLWASYGEMFGIVNVEALACGVPVIGWNNEDAPSAIGGGEIIDHGQHGFIVRHKGYADATKNETIDSAVAYLGELGNIDRGVCRKRFEERFTADIMARKTLQYMNIVRDRGKVGDVTNELT